MKPLQVFAGVGMALLLTSISFSLRAQKLNNIQEAGVWAPPKVKIDARLNEWGANLQAFNKTVSVNYTIANDDKDLYVVIKADDPTIANKIISGGISFTINTAGKKTDKEAYIITFPYVTVTSLRNRMSQFRSQPGGAPGEMPDSAALAQMRKQAVTTFKEIKLVGFKDIADSVISIYNEYGIKAAADYDDKGALICELAMPLKYMNLAGSTAPFSYNLKLNGLDITAMMASMGINRDDMPPGGFGGGGPGGPGGGGGFGGGGGGFRGGGGFGGGGGGFRGGGPGGPGGGFGGGGMRRGGMGDMQSMISPTDFWATYTPAKK
ncbi:MAG: hypothetical protein ABI367_13155 [Mucilaginibacter sp.]